VSTTALPSPETPPLWACEPEAPQQGPGSGGWSEWRRSSLQGATGPRRQGCVFSKLNKDERFLELHMHTHQRSF
jgi:hypothetical protein